MNRARSHHRSLPAERKSQACKGFALIALALAAGWVAPAQAQSAQTDASVLLLEPLSIVKSADMDFGQIMVAGPGGTVTMTPSATASCTPAATLVQTGTCRAAAFEGYGRRNRFIWIRLPAGRTITLTGPGTPMVVNNMTIGTTSDLNQMGNGNGNQPYRILSSTGLFTFWVGGTLNVNANQLPGVYSTTFDVRLEYQ